MDIVALFQELSSGLLQAEEKFFLNPSGMADFEKDVADASYKMAARFMSDVLTDMNEMYKNSSKRKELFNVQRTDKRTLITTVGDVTFEHTLFKKRDKDGTYTYLLDDLLELPKHERFSCLAEAKALYEAEVHSYQHAADSLSVGTQTVSKTAVMEKVHGIVADLPKDKICTEKKCCEFLYVEADEDHIHRQKNDEQSGCMIGKLIYLFEGKKELCEGRKILVNPHYHGGLYQGSEANRKLWEEVQNYIEEHYDTDILKRVYISGDGGSWIKAGKDYVDKSVLVADRFHLMKYIYRVSNLTLDESDITKQRLYRYIYKNNLLATKKLLTRIKNSAGHDDLIEDTRAYFVNNWDAIQRAFHDKNVLGCSAEGHVSNILSERMSSRPMGWSETGSDRMCKLRCYVRNCGREKIVNLVEYRRKEALRKHRATGTEGIAVEVKPKNYYTRQQRKVMTYAESLHASIGGGTIKKMLAIRERLNEI